MMVLPDDFQFSQASLQDFVACPRRFQLRYLMGLRWPAVPAEPIEEHERRMRLGTEFHRLVQRYLLGVPRERITRSVRDPELQSWWQSFLSHDPLAQYGGDDSAAKVRSELSLVGRAAGYRLVAKCDVVIVVPGRQAVILDWKTSNRPPSVPWLRRRLQTRVYPYVLVQAGSYLNGQVPVQSRQVEMVYWYPGFPDQTVRLPYSASQYAQDGEYLERQVETIAACGESDFALTEDEKSCNYCAYRSYCGRGDRAGNIDDVDTELDFDVDPGDFDFDLEQIAEIEF